MEDFESTPEFQALQVAAAGKPERSMGESVIPAEPPAWGDVLRQAKALEETAANQLALHVYLIQASTHVKGFPGFLESMQVVCELFQQQWDDMYPPPDTDDPDDMYYERVNLMNEISERPEFLEALYRLPLVSVRGIGEFSTRDLDISQGLLSASEEDTARCQEGLIRGAFTESDKDELAKLAEAIEGSANIIQQIEQQFAEKAGQAGVLSLTRLNDRVAGCYKRFMEFASDQLTQSDTVVEDPEVSLQEADSSTEANSQVIAPPKQNSAFDNRGQVKSAFNAILLYYQTHEPSSPVRILTIRAKDFVDKSFFEVVQALVATEQEDLAGLLNELQNQPLSALLRDSFARHKGGEVLTELTPADVVITHPDDLTADAPAGNSTPVSVINSREDVLNTLQDIEVFFHHSEPASPLPMIIADIRRLVPKRFSELVSEFSRLVPATDKQDA